MLQSSAFVSADFVCALVEEHLSVGEFLRLCMCSKELLALCTSADVPGFLYRPMQRTFPFITGLAPGRKMSYYVSIVRGYYQDQAFPSNQSARIKLYLGLHFPFSLINPDVVIQECIRMCRTACFSAQGRRLVLAHLNELVEIYGMCDWKTVDVLSRLIRIVDQAFCVQRRRLQPGKVVRLQRMRQTFQQPEYDYESEGLDL